MTDALWDVELVDEELTIKFDLKPAESIDELLTNVEYAISTTKKGEWAHSYWMEIKTTLLRKYVKKTQIPRKKT
tara:strand:+ start:2797 stop:3018 length:222 start_codon:yes stop_codon:yes gene_type:complete